MRSRASRGCTHLLGSTFSNDINALALSRCAAGIQSVESPSGRRHRVGLAKTRMARYGVEKAAGAFFVRSYTGHLRSSIGSHPVVTQVDNIGRLDASRWLTQSLPECASLLILALQANNQWFNRIPQLPFAHVGPEGPRLHRAHQGLPLSLMVPASYIYISPIKKKSNKKSKGDVYAPVRQLGQNLTHPCVSH